MAMLYGVPLILGSVGAYFIGNMFEEGLKEDEELPLQTQSPEYVLSPQSSIQAPAPVSNSVGVNTTGSKNTTSFTPSINITAPSWPGGPQQPQYPQYRQSSWFGGPQQPQYPQYRQSSWFGGPQQPQYPQPPVGAPTQNQAQQPSLLETLPVTSLAAMMTPAPPTPLSTEKSPEPVQYTTPPAATDVPAPVHVEPPPVEIAPMDTAISGPPTPTNLIEEDNSEMEVPNTQPIEAQNGEIPGFAETPAIVVPPPPTANQIPSRAISNPLPASARAPSARTTRRSRFVPQGGNRRKN